MFSCAKGEWVLGEVVGIGLGKATLQFENTGIAGANDGIFVSDSSFKVGDV